MSSSPLSSSIRRVPSAADLHSSFPFNFDHHRSYHLLSSPHFFLPLSFFFLLLLSSSSFASSSPSSSSSMLDNAVMGDPLVDCMADRVKLTFRTRRPFNGRIFVKGMVENDNCVNNYQQNSRTQVDFELTNGQCNMRRSRKLGPEQRGVEQSITIIISFHDIFITKVDRAYRCTCFYMEADKVVTNRFDVSMIPTTELIDTARMPLCTYTVRRGSVNGPIVTYATIGEPVFHVWSCDSDMFSMLVHNCFVDDGAGKDRKPLIDEHGCTIDPVIVSELTYNSQANLAYSEVNVFKFADKVTTYFQCAVSTCMISEGMCSGKTPPRCGENLRERRSVDAATAPRNDGNTSSSVPFPVDDPYTMDLAADKIVVLDLDDSAENGGEGKWTKSETKRRELTSDGHAVLAAASRLGLSSPSSSSPPLTPSYVSLPSTSTVCLSQTFAGAVMALLTLIVLGSASASAILLWRQRREAKNSCDF